MTNKAKVLYSDQLAGYLEKTDNGYSFTYDHDYLKSEHPKPVSQTLPLSPYTQISRSLFPFFDGLIPKGWLLNIASNHWKTLCQQQMAAWPILPKDLTGRAAQKST